jgi:hypothetical protein
MTAIAEPPPTAAPRRRFRISGRTTPLLRLFFRWRLWRDDHGQDLVEFALLVALVGVASGLFMPNLRQSMDTIYSRMQSKLIEAGG